MWNCSWDFQDKSVYTALKVIVSTVWVQCFKWSLVICILSKIPVYVQHSFHLAFETLIMVKKNLENMDLYYKNWTLLNQFQTSIKLMPVRQNGHCKIVIPTHRYNMHICLIADFKYSMHIIQKYSAHLKESVKQNHSFSPFKCFQNLWLSCSHKYGKEQLFCVSRHRKGTSKNVWKMKFIF